MDDCYTIITAGYQYYDYQWLHNYGYYWLSMVTDGDTNIECYSY